MQKPKTIENYETVMVEFEDGSLHTGRADQIPWSQVKGVVTAPKPATEEADILAAASRPHRVAVLQEAADLIVGDRNRDYGEPVANHQHIADIASAITGHALSARDVALILPSVKWARLAKSPTHRDSYVDLAGYTGIAYECALGEDK